MPFDNYFKSSPKARKRLAIPKAAGPTFRLEMRGPGDVCWVHIVDVSQMSAGEELAQWRDENQDFEFRLAPE